MGFKINGIIFGAVLVFIGILIISILPKKEKFAKQLSRERNMGTAMGFIALLWAANLTIPLLKDFFPNPAIFLYPIVLLLTILSFMYLEYLFTRAFAGLLLLMCRWIITEAYIDHAPMRPVLTIICIIIAIFCMIFIQWPWIFRRSIDKILTAKKFRLNTSIVFFIFGIFSIGIAIMTK